MLLFTQGLAKSERAQPCLFCRREAECIARACARRFAQAWDTRSGADPPAPRPLLGSLWGFLARFGHRGVCCAHHSGVSVCGSHNTDPHDRAHEARRHGAAICVSDGVAQQKLRRGMRRRIQFGARRSSRASTPFLGRRLGPGLLFFSLGRTEPMCSPPGGGAPASAQVSARVAAPVPGPCCPAHAVPGAGGTGRGSAVLHKHSLTRHVEAAEAACCCDDPGGLRDDAGPNAAAPLCPCLVRTNPVSVFIKTMSDVPPLRVKADDASSTAFCDMTAALQTVRAWWQRRGLRPNSSSSPLDLLDLHLTFTLASSCCTVARRLVVSLSASPFILFLFHFIAPVCFPSCRRVQTRPNRPSWAGGSVRTPLWVSVVVHTTLTRILRERR